VARKLATTNDAKAHRVPELAGKYRIGTHTVRQAIKSGKLKASKLGDSPRSPLIILDEDAREWIESCRMQPEAA
jgi:hypothetical protein